MGTLQDKVAIVSGSGRGIGREIALRLASEGARVVVNDLDPEPAEQTAADIRAAGGEAVVCAGSVVADGFAEQFVAAAVDNFGGLDIIVNNAGYTWDAVIQKMTDEQWDAILDVHLKAPFRIMRAATAFIKANPTEYHRKVVNISSVSGVRPAPGIGFYGVTKAALIHLTEELAVELAPKVRVNAVAPAVVKTRFAAALFDGREEQVAASYPLARLGVPEDVAATVAFLSSAEAGWITGQTIVLDGGVTLTGNVQ